MFQRDEVPWFFKSIHFVVLIKKNIKKHNLITYLKLALQMHFQKMYHITNVISWYE